MTKQITFILILLVAFKTTAQVEDISITISPAAEYTMWDDAAGLDNGSLVGGKMGFGLGEFVELRATYMQGLDLQTNFENFGLASFSEGLIPQRDVELTRWGGELKANFGTRTKLNPYLTLGSGVQTLQLKDLEENEQIFATLGLGAKFNLSNRIVLALEAKNTMFNFNAGSRLLTADDQTALGVTDADFDTETLSNWSAMASLQFYLGGRRPGEYTDLDRAYLNTFSSGFRGIRFDVEPSLAYIDFDDDSRFRDTWLLGGYAGIDFNDFIGLRGFYFRASNNEEVSTDFDNLEMYGGEFRARLNVPRGVVPYLSIGGGYLNAYQNYIGEDDLMNVQSSYFASGGLGLNVPLSKNIVAFGSVNALLTSDTNEEDLQTPDELKTHTMYSFGVKFNIGSKAKSAQGIYQQNVDENVSEALAEQRKENRQKIESLKKEYNSQITQLEKELQQANEAKDVDKAVEIIEEKNEVKKALKEVENVEKNEKNEKVEDQRVEAVKKDLTKRIDALERELERANTTNDLEKAIQLLEEKNQAKRDLREVEELSMKSYAKSSVPTQELIQMTPAEFELLISRILDKVQSPAPQTKSQPQNSQSYNTSDDALRQRMEILESLLLQLNAKGLEQSSAPASSKTTEEEQKNILSMEILSKLNELNSKIEHNANKIDLLGTTNGESPQTIIVNPNQTEGATAQGQQTITTTAQANQQNKSLLEKLDYKYSSAMLGFMLGDNTFGLASLRLHYAISDTKFEFMPEVFFGITDPVSYGLSFNGIRPFELGENSKFHPYAGAGVGFMKIRDYSKLNANLIIGSYFNVWNGKLFVDFTTRNFFDYNQISVGYKIDF